MKKNKLKQSSASILMSMACLFIVGCGKEIKSSQKTEDEVVVRPPLSDSTVTLKLDKMNSDKKEYGQLYQLNYSGWATIPAHPIIIEGNSSTVKTSILFNSNEEKLSTDIESIRCDYLSIKELATNLEDNKMSYRHYFKGCFSNVYGNEEEVNYIPGQEVALNSGRFILFKSSFSKSKDPVSIFSSIDIQWH